MVRYNTSGPLICIAFLTVVVGCIQRHEPPTGSNTATLHLSRDSLFLHGGLVRIDLFINETKVGSLADGESDSWRFVPLSGENVFQIQHTNLKGTTNYSNLLKVEIKPGEVFSARCGFDTNQNLWLRSSATSLSIAGLANLRLSDSTRRVKAGEETVTSVLGADQRIFRAHTIDQTADFSNSTIIGTNTGLNLELVSAQVTTQIEGKRSIRLNKTQTISREVTISGFTAGRKYKLIWYDLIRDGSIDIPATSGITTTPFSYKEDSVLEIEVIP